MAVTCVQLAGVLGSYVHEARGIQTPYSKFAKGKSLSNPIPSRVGMLLIYLPATMFNLYELIARGSTQFYSDNVFILNVAIFIHFLKRVVETLFVHRYSGDTEGTVAAFIGAYYTVVSWIIIHFHQNLGVKTSLYSMSTKLGIFFFVVGELGNFYHHKILSKLRHDSKFDSRTYFVPNGGLFDYVATPHYFFELIAWLGIAFISQQGSLTNSFTHAAELWSDH